MSRASGRAEAFAVWLAAFGDAWEAGDAARLTTLFTVAAAFAADPFAALVRGRRSIVAAFGELFASWPGASFSAQVLGAGDTYGVAHWRVASGERALDGIWVVALEPRGRCESLRQWWHASKASAPVNVVSD